MDLGLLVRAVATVATVKTVGGASKRPPRPPRPSRPSACPPVRLSAPTLTLLRPTRYSPRPMRKSLLVAAMLLLAACSEPRKEPQLGEALPFIPVPPSSQVVSREGGEDAIKIRFRSTEDPDKIAAYYRDLLSKPPWRLVSDTREQDGGVALYAEQDGPPLWVTIRKADGAEGTLVDLAGAKTKRQ